MREFDAKDLYYELQKVEAGLQKIRANQERREDLYQKILSNQEKFADNWNKEVGETVKLREEVKQLKEELNQVKLKGNYYLGIFAAVTALLGFIVPWVIRKIMGS